MISFLYWDIINTASIPKHKRFSWFYMRILKRQYMELSRQHYCFRIISQIASGTGD